MKRSHAIAALLCAAVCLGFALRLARNATPTPLPLQAPAPTRVAANTSAPPDGAYVDKDKLIYVNYGTRDPALQAFMLSLMNGSYDTAAKGRAIFLKICAACHQPDGTGKDGVAPPLAGSEWVLAEKGDRLVRIVLNGMSGPVRVKDREWNLVMLPWREALKDDEIALVLTYVRSKIGTNNAGPIKPESVSDARKESHPGPETAVELLKSAE
jgi:mono/diheme cytochrome c family protein